MTILKRWPPFGQMLAAVGSCLLAVSAIILYVVNRDTVIPPSWGISSGARNTPQALVYLILAVFLIPFTVGIGLLILRRQPGNRIGWLMTWAALASGVQVFVSELTIWSNFTDRHRGWLAGLSSWVYNFIWVVPIVLVCWLSTVFPDGRLPSPRWRWIHSLLWSFAFGLGFSSIIEPSMHSAFNLPNRIVPEFPGRIWLYSSLFVLGVAAVLASMLGLVALIYVRFLRARGAERQQFKWLGFSAMGVAALTVFGVVLAFSLGSTAGQILVNFSVALFPLGVGVATLRYRLYDVDIFIRRTLVYSVVSALLALVYFGSVLLMQTVFTALTGQGSSAAVVVSTLVIAALFLPLRARVQDLVDRRFYRRKYDSAKALADFSAAARDETDLAVLSTRLTEVLEETMQPQKISVWFNGRADVQIEEHRR